MQSRKSIITISGKINPRDLIAPVWPIYYPAPRPVWCEAAVHLCTHTKHPKESTNSPKNQEKHPTNYVIDAPTHPAQEPGPLRPFCFFLVIHHSGGELGGHLWRCGLLGGRPRETDLIHSCRQLQTLGHQGPIRVIVPCVHHLQTSSVSVMTLLTSYWYASALHIQPPSAEIIIHTPNPKNYQTNHNHNNHTSNQQQLMDTRDSQHANCAKFLRGRISQQFFSQYKSGASSCEAFRCFGTGHGTTIRRVVRPAAA